MNNMRILVTGGAGFIGSHTVDLLIEKGHEVFVIDNLSSGKNGNLNSRAVFYEVDLGAYEKIKDIFEKERFDIAYHLAAQIDVRESVDDPIEDARVNILNSLNLLECCVKFNVKHFVFSSSGGAIYGDGVELPTVEEADTEPVSPYGCAKFSVEKYLHFYYKVYGLKFSALRYANVYGPRQNSEGEAGVVAIFFESMFNNKNPVIFWGKQTRDFVYVGDVALANVLALHDKEKGVYNIGTGVETDIISLFSKMNKFFCDRFLADFKEKKKGEQVRSCLSFLKIKNNLGWKPLIELNSGLKKTYEWFLERI